MSNLVPSLPPARPRTRFARSLRSNATRAQKRNRRVVAVEHYCCRGHSGVPFVDVMCTMRDASIPLTTGEWEEWGNPNEAK